MLDEVMRYKASLAKLTITLEQAEQYSRSVAGRVGFNNPRLAVTNGNKDSDVAVYTEPAPRIGEQTYCAPYYLVDELPDEDLINRVGETYIEGERRSVLKENGRPTLAEIAKSKTSS